LGWSDERVQIGDNGKASFFCGETSVSVFVNEKAPGRELFGKSKGAFKIPID